MNVSCSLEHCHTNLFAIQTLNNLKWKCLRANVQPHRTDSNKDPVLLAYWKLLHEDILCSWRRVLSDDRQRTQRELWVFTTHEDLPTDLPNLQPILSAGGSWGDSAMSYECRSMLFKALHNKIEKYLLSRGFTRLNKWFILPVNNNSDVKVPNLSFNFNFFLHGSSRICTSINVRQHEDIFHLTENDLEQIDATPILLAPYGVSAKLIGLLNRDTDVTSLREHWKNEYPLRRMEGLPEFVEVALGNHRMIYPTCYIFKTRLATSDPTNLPSKTSNIKKSSELVKNKTKASKIEIKPLEKATVFDILSVKQITNDLIVNAQRQNLIDTRRLNETSAIMNDPIALNTCECSLSNSTTVRQAAQVPFHRRAKPNSITPTTTEYIPTTEIETNGTSRLLNTPDLSQTQEQRTNSNYMRTSTPNVFDNSSPSTNPASNSSEIPRKTLKRTVTTAFGEKPIDESDNEDAITIQQQIYNFSPTDRFLRYPLKKFRQDHHDNEDDDYGDHNDNKNENISYKDRLGSFYQHGQSTPPSPLQRIPGAADYTAELRSSLNNYRSFITTDHSSPSSFDTFDRPSMDDLRTIIQPDENQAHSEDHTDNAISSTRADDTVFSPIPQENIFSMFGTSIGSSSIGANDIPFPSNRAIHGNLESIFITPPNSLSSERFQLSSPYGMLVEPVNYLATTTENHFPLANESIIVPFELSSIVEHTSYNAYRKTCSIASSQRYEPSIELNKRHPVYQIMTRWRPMQPSENYISYPASITASILRRQPDSVNTTYSPVRSTDLRSNSPCFIRSVGSIQTTNSPQTTITTTTSIEIDSALLNTFLSDSILNHFRDSHFDLCVLCPCKSNELSIHGQEAIIYLKNMIGHHAMRQTHPIQSQSMYNSSSCSCGFSSVVNLRLSLSSGLLYEDEVEITGSKTEVKYREPKSLINAELLQMIEMKESVSTPFDYHSRPTVMKMNFKEHLPFYRYENGSFLQAVSKAITNPTVTITDELKRSRLLHPWSYQSSSTVSNQQTISMLRSLKPLLVDALKRATTNNSRNIVDGPLTWKSFYQLLHVENPHPHIEEQISGPQPIPQVVAGFDQEWLSLTPYGLKYWDKLSLEPYSKQKNALYVAVVPDNDYICTLTKSYLREVSCSYELCHLGIHRPCVKTFPDQGLIRVPLSNDAANTANVNNDLTNSSVDTWLDTQTNLDANLIERLKQCARSLKNRIVDLLTNSPSLNTAMIDEQTNIRDNLHFANDLNDSNSTFIDIYGSVTTSPSSLSNTSTATSTTTAPSSSSFSTTHNMNTSSSDLSNNLTSYVLASTNTQSSDHQDLRSFESFYHGKTLNDDQAFLVIYIVDTLRYELLTMNNQQSPLNGNVEVLMKTFAFRIHIDLMKILPERIGKRVEIQLIPFESIVHHHVEFHAELRATHSKRVAFHVYNEFKRIVTRTKRAKSLTGLGPASLEEKICSNQIFQLYTPAYILSPRFDARYKPFMEINEKSILTSTILYCSYCFSDDQKYVLVSCCDERGELLETCSINIEIPDRAQRKSHRAARITVQKIWDFILRVVTRSSMPWRIVVGRVGRLGHGELKYWGLVLSKKNLVRCAVASRESCSMCQTLRNYEHPMILSACLISINTHSLLKILPESFEVSEMRSSQSLNTSLANLSNQSNIFNDVSVTHILTFPTSPYVQHYEPTIRQSDHRHLLNEDVGDIFDVDINDDMSSPPPNDIDFQPGNSSDPSGSDITLSRFTNLLSSHGNLSNNGTYAHSSSVPLSRFNSLINLESDVDSNEIPSLQQQPLALGFYVSTIGPLNPLPSWMLRTESEYQTLEQSNRSSSVFKAALHINIPNAQHSDDIQLLKNRDQKPNHPLDSDYTYVILRYVLESYNRLSWLLMDTKSNERASCLPIHIEQLLRLYQAFMKFV